jgi:3-(3-hydroxy-phenyl)propionate hydroxylase
VRELTSRIKGVGAVICERDPARARARDAKLLADCGGRVQDTPRQDILPRLEGGLLSSHPSSARGTLFPQPWLRSGAEVRRMDELAGHGWRLVLRGPAPAVNAPPGVRVLSLADLPETEGVLAHWFQRHECEAALVRPDHYVYGVAASAAATAALLDEAAARLGFATACAA